MTILDAYAVIAFLKDEPAAGEVRPLLAGGGKMTASGIAEVVDHLVRVAGSEAETVVLDLAELDLLQPTVVDRGLGVSAGMLRARHYHHTTCAISMADCVVAETARARGEPLATSDPHLLDVCAGEGIPYKVLPGSDGTRWSPGP